MRREAGHIDERPKRGGMLRSMVEASASNVHVYSRATTGSTTPKLRERRHFRFLSVVHVVFFFIFWVW